MPGSIDVDDLVAFLQSRSGGGNARNGGGRGGGGGGNGGGGGGRGRGLGDGGAGGSWRRGGDNRGGGGGGRGRGQSGGGTVPQRRPRDADAADPYRVKDWHCGICGESNRAWRSRCFGCRRQREAAEEPRAPLSRTPATRPSPPARGAAGERGAQTRGGPQPARAAAASPGAATAISPPSVSLRPGGWAAAVARGGNLHSNSVRVDKGAEVRGGHTAAEGVQLAGAQGDGGPPRAKTVSIGEASKGMPGEDGFVAVRAATRPRVHETGATENGGGGGATSSGEGDPHHPQGEGGEGANAPPRGGQPQTQGTGEGDADADGQDDDQGPSEEDLRAYWEAAKEMLAFAKRQGHPPEHPVRRGAEQQVAETLAAWRAVRPPRAVHTRMGWAEEALQRAKKAQAKAEQELDDFDRHYEAERERMVEALREARNRTRERTQALADLSREAAEEYHGDGGQDYTQETRLLHGAFRTLDADVGPAVEAVLGGMDQASQQYTVLRAALDQITNLHCALGAATGGSAADFFDMSEGDGERGQQQQPSADTAVGTAGGKDASDDMDTSAVRAPRWMEAKRGGELDPASATGSTPPRWKKNRAMEGGAGEPKGADEPKPPAGGQGAAAAAAAGGDDGGDEFASRREQIVAQAKFDGVDVPEEYLRQLCPEALDEWAREHLL